MSWYTGYIPTGYVEWGFILSTILPKLWANFKLLEGWFVHNSLITRKGSADVVTNFMSLVPGWCFSSVGLQRLFYCGEPGNFKAKFISNSTLVLESHIYGLPELCLKLYIVHRLKMLSTRKPLYIPIPVFQFWSGGCGCNLSFHS